MKKTVIFYTLLCTLAMLSACNNPKFLIGTWKATNSEFVPQGPISQEDQMIINMINGMLQNVMNDMSITFHEDGDYQIQFYQEKGLGTYELRANNSVLLLKDDETFGKIYAEFKDNDNKEKELILNFGEELMADPGWEEMVAELGVPFKLKITFKKEKKK